MVDFSTAAVPGNFLANFFPALKYLPRWMPGAGFLKKAEEWGKNQYDATWIPYKWTEEHMATGETYLPSLVGSVLHETGGNLPPGEKHSLVWSTGAVLGGGLDTVRYKLFENISTRANYCLPQNMATILNFFYAMILHPDIQRKAQAEIDALLRNQRLPTLTDRSSLPYIRALVTEVYRWRTAGPLGRAYHRPIFLDSILIVIYLGVPHSLNKDDVYNGHMLHDPNIYPDPMTFNPERYKGLDTEMKKVTDLAFGFGRRACPGYHFAQGTIYSIVMTTLATCDILPPLAADGKEYIPETEYSSGTISLPSRFDVRIKSRSLRAQELLNDVLSKERM
ncbi:hypothetical protein Clacol_008615 [Clathrus columnatus]|uniref:Cytochrome P450 n=1 Tax=Clathrus columnatus TaxID=1419009 RepID=A0AAV5AN96_9AGAM|nr:hypothetical protein Clacol_008615 [Clathrus columnatus]